jgi:hypothetical protein
MNYIKKHIQSRCSKYIIEYLDTKQPFISELLNKTEILYNDTSKYIFNENNHYNINDVHKVRYKFKSRIIVDNNLDWMTIATHITE